MNWRARLWTISAGRMQAIEAATAGMHPDFGSRDLELRQSIDGHEEYLRLRTVYFWFIDVENENRLSAFRPLRPCGVDQQVWLEVLRRP